MIHVFEIRLLSLCKEGTLAHAQSSNATNLEQSKVTGHAESAYLKRSNAKAFLNMNGRIGFVV